MINQERDHPVDALLRRMAGDPTPTAAERNHTWRVLAAAIRRESLSRRRRIGGTRDRPEGWVNPIGGDIAEAPQEKTKPGP